MTTTIRPNYYRVSCPVRLADGTVVMAEVECIDVIRALGMTFDEGNVLKYAWRAGNKANESKLEDARKALTYAGFLVDGTKKLTSEQLVPLAHAAASEMAAMRAASTPSSTAPPAGEMFVSANAWACAVCTKLKTTAEKYPHPVSGLPTCAQCAMTAKPLAPTDTEGPPP